MSAVSVGPPVVLAWTPPIVTVIFRSGPVSSLAVNAIPLRFPVAPLMTSSLRRFPIWKYFGWSATTYASAPPFRKNWLTA